MAENNEQLYKGEKEPESKEEQKAPLLSQQHEAVCGFPVGPIGEGIPMGEPMEEAQQPWSTGMWDCLGSYDEHCGSDMEVCILGTFAPCVLFGSNSELIDPERNSFLTQCCAYASLDVIGAYLGWNCLSRMYAFPTRVALRKTHNLEGHGERFMKNVGCCAFKGDMDREQCNSFCDCLSHFFCHPCALCQESREIRRRTRNFVQRQNYMAAPAQQTME